MAKPFLKWPGGKSQLIGYIKDNLPYTNFTYIESFIGGGSILFWILNNFDLKNVIINDINENLINAYKTISSKPKELICILKTFQNEFHSLEPDTEKKKEYYYNKRELYNSKISDIIAQSALLIFLNKTCFNGLYRVNQNNGFNVPMGSYIKPTICDEQNIMLVSDSLKNVKILCGNYEKTIDYVNENTFFYFDPPFKPINKTSSFNSYAKDIFNDNEQIRLRNFCNKLHENGHKFMLSNSDPGDNFFDEIYSEYCINRVKSRRSINVNPDKRGKINEILVTNYDLKF